MAPMNPKRGTPKPATAPGVRTYAAGSLLTPQFLGALIGSVLYWSWMFLFYWTDSLVSYLAFDEGLLCKGCGFCGSAVTLGLIYLIGKHRARFLANGVFGIGMPAVFTPVVGVVNILEVYVGFNFSLPVLLVCWFISGIGIAFILVQSGEMLCHLVNEATMLLLSMTLFLSAMLCMLLLQTGSGVVECYMIAAPWFSLGIARAGLRERHRSGQDAASDVVEASGASEAPEASETPAVSEPPKTPKFNSPESRMRYRLLIVQQLLFSIVFSFGQFASVCYASVAGYAIFDFFWIALFLSGVLFLLYSSWLNRYVSLNSLQMILLLLTAFSIIFLTLTALDVRLRFCFSVMLCLGFTAFDVLSMYQLARTVAVNKLPFARYFSAGRFANALGMFVGWVLVYGAILLNGGQVAGVQFQYVLVVAFILLVFYFAFASRVQPSEEDAAVSVPGTVRSEEEAPKRPAEGYWKRATRVLSERFALSPREIDVFELLGRGRDTSYICDSLFISASTVKTHSYHIYQKMGVHSQQELISAVEKEVTLMRTGEEQA